MPHKLPVYTASVLLVSFCAPVEAYDGVEEGVLGSSGACHQEEQGLSVLSSARARSRSIAISSYTLIVLLRDKTGWPDSEGTVPV